MVLESILIIIYKYGKALGADKKQYEIADFRARGMNYTNAIGIIVTTEFMSRILAFDTWQERWGNTDRVLTEEQNESVAMQTFSGLDLTKRIVEGQAGIDGMTAAKRCWNYQKGGFQWYLPCLMELGVLCAYRDEINKAMKEIGCPDECLLPTEDSDETWVWSSSEGSQGNSWSVNFSNGNFISGGKYGSGMVRAVAAFQPSPSLLTGEAKSNDCLHSDEALINMLRERGYKGELTKTLTI